MEKLVALRDILYESKIYAPGEELPANNHEMTKAWIEAGSAIWKNDEAENKKANTGTPEDVKQKAEEPEAGSEAQEDTDQKTAQPETKPGEPKEGKPQKTMAKAIPKSAEPGIGGTSTSKEGGKDNQVAGKVPRTPKRTK